MFFPLQIVLGNTPAPLPSPADPNVAPGQVGGSEALGTAIETSQKIAENWQSSWGQIINPNNGMWGGLCSLATVVVAGSLMFWAVTIGKQIMEKEDWSGTVNHLVWPIVIAILLANQGTFLSKIILTGRGIMYKSVIEVMEMQVGQIKLREALNDAVLTANTKASIQLMANACIKIQDAAQRTQCLQKLQQDAEAEVQRAEQQTGGKFISGIRRWWNKLSTAISNSAQPIPGTNIPDPGGALFGFANAIENSLWQSAALSILSGLQWAFINLMELAMLLTALLGPIAVAGSLLPMQGKPIWAWASGFFSMGLALLGYNIIVGLCAEIIVKAEAQEVADFQFMLLISLLSPIAALGIASGAGLSLYKGLSDGTVGLINTAANIGTTLINVAGKFIPF